ncbi:MAG: response regulator transcription factor [Candidatus Nanopelagicus sp.]
MKPLIIFYSEQCSNTSGTSLHKYVERNLDAEIAPVSTWADLVLAVTRAPLAIVFHNKMIDPNEGCKPLLEKIKRICMRLPHKINIGVYIDYENSPELITELQTAGVVGLVPNPEHFGIDSSVEGLRCIMNGKSHWPSDIITCLSQPKPKPKKTKSISKIVETFDLAEVEEVIQVNPKALDDVAKLPNIVYFKFNHHTSPKCTEELANRIKSTWTMPSTWQQLTQEIASGERTIATHIDMIEQAGTSVMEYVEMIQMMVKFMPSSEKLKIGVVITKNTNLKIIQELKQTPVTGLLLDINEFSFDEVAAALAALLAGTQYWPEHIIKTLPGNKAVVERGNGVTLTERQAQIANLICKRGLSNKKVANMLTITESTVKAHVSAILKAYGVRNRTQLVLSANK